MNKKLMERMQKIIEGKYAQLAFSVMGASQLTKDELKYIAKAKKRGLSNTSILTAIYKHHYINNGDNKLPKTVKDMLNQQNNLKLPKSKAIEQAIELLNYRTKQQITKLKEDTTSRVLSILGEHQEKDRIESITNQNLVGELLGESSTGKVIGRLKELSKDGNRNWERVALTEIGNAIGAGAVDRIVEDNKSKDLSTVYVYRLPVNDNVTCKHCRKFYGDNGEIPKVYKLTTLIGNGSNMGKKADDWKPVSGATHPNTRTSATIELKEGYILTEGRKQTFVGKEKWEKWIEKHLIS